MSTPAGAELASAIAAADAAAAEAESLVAEAEAAIAAMATASAIADIQNILNGLPLTPGGFGVGDIRMRDNAINVEVNVGGSVISENDLVQSITNSLYNIQSNGQVLLHKRTIL